MREEISKPRKSQAGFEQTLTLLLSAPADPRKRSRHSRNTALAVIILGCGLSVLEAARLDLKDYEAPERIAGHGLITVRDIEGIKKRDVSVPANSTRAITSWCKVRGSEPGALLCPVNIAGNIGAKRISVTSIYRILAEIQKDFDIDKLPSEKESIVPPHSLPKKHGGTGQDTPKRGGVQTLADVSPCSSCGSLAWGCIRCGSVTSQAEAAENARLGRRFSRQGRVLTHGELSALLADCVYSSNNVGRRDAAIIMAMCDGMLFRSEIQDLKIEDWDEQSQSLHVSAAGNRSERVVRLNNVAATAMCWWAEVRGTVPGPMFMTMDNHGRHITGRELPGHSISAMVRKRAVRANIGHVGPNDLQRTGLEQLSNSTGDSPDRPDGVVGDGHLMDGVLPNPGASDLFSAAKSLASLELRPADGGRRSNVDPLETLSTQQLHNLLRRSLHIFLGRVESDKSEAITRAVAEGVSLREATRLFERIRDGDIPSRNSSTEVSLEAKRLILTYFEANPDASLPQCRKYIKEEHGIAFSNLAARKYAASLGLSYNASQRRWVRQTREA